MPAKDPLGVRAAGGSGRPIESRLGKPDDRAFSPRRTVLATVMLATVMLATVMLATVGDVPPTRIPFMHRCCFRLASGKRGLLLAIAVAMLAGPSVAPAKGDEHDSPQWRGPARDGHAAPQSLLQEW